MLPCRTARAQELCKVEGAVRFLILIILIRVINAGLCMRSLLEATSSVKCTNLLLLLSITFAGDQWLNLADLLVVREVYRFLTRLLAKPDGKAEDFIKLSKWTTKGMKSLRQVSLLASEIISDFPNFQTSCLFLALLWRLCFSGVTSQRTRDRLFFGNCHWLTFFIHEYSVSVGPTQVRPVKPVRGRPFGQPRWEFPWPIRLNVV